MQCSEMNTEMARQTTEDHGPLKNTADWTSSGYVKDVAVKFEEKMSKTGSPKVPKRLLLAQRSQNTRISFSLHGPSVTDRTLSGSESRTSDSHTPDSPRNVTDLADSTKARSCLRPGVRSNDTACSRSSDPLILSPKSSDVKSPALLGITSADTVKSQSASDLQLASTSSTASSSGCCDVNAPEKCCVARVNLNMKHGENGSAGASATPARCG